MTNSLYLHVLNVEPHNPFAFPNICNKEIGNSIAIFSTFYKSYVALTPHFAHSLLNHKLPCVHSNNNIIMR